MFKILSVSLIFLFTSILIPQETLIDDFEDLEGWEIIKSDGVEISISSVEGFNGKSIRIDYNFMYGTGYCGIQKKIDITFPENFTFNYRIKADSPTNDWEFKILDSSRENVWWFNQRRKNFSDEWSKETVKKRNISFAWGPTSNRELKSSNFIEFTVASATGGKGTIYIDDFYFSQLTEKSFNELNKTIISSSDSQNLQYLLNDKSNKIWFPEKNWWLTIDLGINSEIGGLIIEWGKDRLNNDFEILLSGNGVDFSEVYSVSDNIKSSSFIRLPGTDTRFIKIKGNLKDSLSIKSITIKPYFFSEDINAFFVNVSKNSKRGYYPRYFNEEKSFWTIFGVHSDNKESLLNEDGMIEVDKYAFSIEPFIFENNNLLTWAESESEQYLLDNYLPVPSVKLNFNQISLDVTTFASGTANTNSSQFIKYTVTNNSDSVVSGKLFLTFRHFLVNPYYQFLNFAGGVSKINSIEKKQNEITINKNYKVYFTGNPEFGVSSFENANITDYLKYGELPKLQSLKSDAGLLSAALEYPYELKPGESANYILIIPYYNNKLSELNFSDSSDYFEIWNTEFEETVNFWKEKLNAVSIELPGKDKKLFDIVRSNLAYILINRDSFGIQPGSRSYERSWIRDGSLTSSAMLKMGLSQEIKEFANWYAGYQYKDGKVPCVVDRRGPDPVDEHDSHGQLIYLFKEYFDFTKDTAFIRDMFPHIKLAVEYIERTTATRKTEKYTKGTDSIRAFFGLMPESISHEGYSEKPMHSYWDNFFVLKGLKDAVSIARVLGKPELTHFITVEKDFRNNLYNSLDLSVKYKNIEYLPGCVELGDFDATSTTIAVYPCNELEHLPANLLHKTFDKYYDFTENRRLPETEWINYTPYELRTLGTFIFLGQSQKAHNLLDFFLDDIRPKGWNHWAEVVWKDYRKPAFIGDMPHTWVGSDFINAFRTFFVYENENDSSIVFGAGITEDWLLSGLSVSNLPGYYGKYSYRIYKVDSGIKIEVDNVDIMPPGGFFFKLPASALKSFNAIYINDKKVDKIPELYFNTTPSVIFLEN